MNARSAPLCGGALALVALGASLLPTEPRPAVKAQSEQPLERIVEACESDNPYLLTTYLSQGNQGVGYRPALVAFQHDLADRGRLELLGQRAIGAAWGLAFDASRHLIYASAFQSMYAGFGAAGIGAIYRYNLATGTIEPWIRVSNAGRDPRDNASGDGFSIADAAVGKISLGGLDLSDNGEEIYTINLYTRQILRYRASDRELLDTFDHGAATEAWAAKEARPFALKFWRGHLYHGVVRDGSLRNSSKDMLARVYESLPDGSQMRLVLEFALDYERNERADGRHLSQSGKWLPWSDERPGQVGYLSTYPQPWLTDIDFAANGDMLIGLRDRNIDTVFTYLAQERSSIGGGDILVARAERTRWTLTTSPEFFDQDAGPGLGLSDSDHDETAMGGIVVLYQTNEVVTTGIDPLELLTHGAFWFDATSGLNTRRRRVTTTTGHARLGKLSGLGDLEPLCVAEMVPSPTSSSTAIPTSTWTPEPTASPTATTSPSATPTATNRPQPTHTVVPTRVPRAIYLPLLLRENCTPEQRRVDVVLVLDASLSMLEPAAQGSAETKLDAARLAGRSFLDTLRLNTGDQAAIVAFNAQATLLTGLTDDRSALDAALASITAAAQTCIVCGMDTGAAELASPRRLSANAPVLILLTDGRSNPRPVGEAVARAAEAKAAGIRIYTIGLGADLDGAALREMASGPGLFFLAPTAQELAGIYRGIAVDIPCPANAFWVGR